MHTADGFGLFSHLDMHLHHTPLHLARYQCGGRGAYVPRGVLHTGVPGLRLTTDTIT